ncbi:hypothetical protein MKW98_027040 [Papaver atlanticum]|uniref:Uncharacterized protein n=1 Tax=Papaver atlanticum TaxID=357466 RepID=A0AAD4RXF5_9MAGN|nr:hypothetical protein MKW98_027040 [Papaver atlanticum]
MDAQGNFWKKKYIEAQNQFAIQKGEDEFEINGLKDKVKLQEKQKAEFVRVVEEAKERVSTAETEAARYKKMWEDSSKRVEESNTRFVDLEKQANSRLKYELDLEKELRVCKTKYEQKLARGISLEKELNQYRSNFIHLNKRIQSLKEDSKFNRKIGDLECEKRRAEDKLKVSNAKVGKLESQAAALLKELDVYKRKSNALSAELKQKEMERAWYESKLNNLTSIKDAFKDQPEGYKTAFSRLREEIIGLADERKAIYEREKETEERVAYLKDVIKKMESDNREMRMQDLRLEQDSTMRCSDAHGEAEGEQRALQNNVSYTDNGKEAINRQLDSEMDGGTNNALVVPVTMNKSNLSNTKNILTSDIPASSSYSPHGKGNELVPGPLSIVVEQVEPLNVESGFGARKRIHIKSEERTVPLFEQGCSDNEDLVPSFKRLFPNQKGCDIKCTADDTTLSSAPKRRMLVKIEPRDSVSEEDDTALNGKHKVKCFEELAASPKRLTYPVNPCAGDVTFSSEVHNFEQYITSSRQSFFALRKCIEKKSQQVDGTSQGTIRKLTAAEDEKKVVEKTDSYKVVEKTDSYNEDCSRDSENAVDEGEIDFGAVVAMMRRIRNEELKNLGQE